MGTGYNDSGVRKGILERFENGGGGAAASAYKRPAAPPQLRNVLTFVAFYYHLQYFQKTLAR